MALTWPNKNMLPTIPLGYSWITHHFVLASYAVNHVDSTTSAMAVRNVEILFKSYIYASMYISIAVNLKLM